MFKSRQLKHHAVEVELRRLASRLPGGTKFPGERDLAIEFKCNFLTVRKALKRLVDDGLIVRRIGSGTFVTDKKAEPASSLPTSSRVGVLVYAKGDAYESAVCHAIAKAGRQESVDIRSCWVQDFMDDGSRQAEMLVQDGCSALILPWFPHELTAEIRSFVSRCPVPVSLPIRIPGLEDFYFEEKELFDTEKSEPIKGLCVYFSKLGYRRIAFLGPDNAADIVLQQRLRVYSGFVAQQGYPTLCGLVAPGTGSMDRLAKEWKPLCHDLAIVSYDDQHALRFLTAMHKLGLAAPRDFAIMGYNNIDASLHSDPPLSTVAQDFDHIGLWLVRSAVALSKGTTDRAKELPSLKMFVRDTCGGSGRIVPELRATLGSHSLTVVSESTARASDERRSRQARTRASATANG